MDYRVKPGNDKKEKPNVIRAGEIKLDSSASSARMTNLIHAWLITSVYGIADEQHVQPAEQQVELSEFADEAVPV